MAYLLLALISLGAHSGEFRLTYAQEPIFRGWFSRIVWEQLRFRPNSRWEHRDCAGLVRFALTEAFRDHTPEWKQQNSISSMLTPPELELSPAQKTALPVWSFMRAIQLIQRETKFISKDLNQALPGDLLFYDHGDSQHLMVWMGSYVAYHTGSTTPKDNGLRKLTPNNLMTWKDTRWRPLEQNPNFIGIYRFSFLR